MALESQKKELSERVAALVQQRFAGNYKMAFDFYDRKHKDNKITKEELIELLSDAGAGNWITRGLWADGIIAELDCDKDGGISWNEFQAVMQ